MSCSSVLEPLWREGLSMDSSIFSDDDDCLDWRWPASPSSSPRRCDRERGLLDTEFHSAHQNDSLGRTSSCCSSSSSSHGSLEENFFYCTEELGSESVCGSVDPCIARPDKGISISCSSSNLSGGHSSLLASVDSFAQHHHHHHHHHHQWRAAFRRGQACTFPPPISSLLTDRPLMQSFKSNGRFILKKVTNVCCSLFHATRSNGSLRLDLLPPSSDCVESQQGLFFPAMEDMIADAESASSSDESAHAFGPLYLKSNSPSYHLRSSPASYAISLQPKLLLSQADLFRPSKLQAFAMLVNPKGAFCPEVGKPDTSANSEAAMGQQLMKDEAEGGTISAAAMADRARPRVFALLKVLPRGGLGLIIFEVGRKFDGSGNIRVHGMCILESSGHLIPTSKDQKGKLSSLCYEGCRGERYMVKGVFT